MNLIGVMYTLNIKIFKADTQKEEVFKMMKRIYQV